MSVGQAKKLVRLVERTVPGRTATLMVHSVLQRRRMASGSIHNDSGRRHNGKLDLEESLEVIDRQFSRYIEGLKVLAGHNRPSVEGKRILEVGPGDASAVAALFAAAGAEEVISLDRFEPTRDTDLDDRICASVIDRFDAEAAGLDAPPSAPWPELRNRISYLPGVPLETAPQRDGLGQFDLIISCAVLEHVYDLDASFVAMDRLLRPGGQMVHIVDLRDHGLYSESGHHPLTHLTLPANLYRFISQPAGAPNRMLAPSYRTQLEQLGYDAQITTTHLLFDDGRTDPSLKRYHDGTVDELLAPIRGRLHDDFSALPDDDLNAAGIRVLAAKPLSCSIG